jgi:hypothetical protein
MKNKIYVGFIAGQRPVIFRSEIEPTHESHGHLYNASMGPFRTLRGARFMRNYGIGNPHARTVNDCERLGKMTLAFPD